MSHRHMPNLYELRLDDEENEYDYCDDSKVHDFNGGPSRMTRSISMENNYCEDELEKGDAGAPTYYGRTYSTHENHYSPSDSQRQEASPAQIIPSPSSPVKTSMSSKKPVAISTSTLHVTPVPPTAIGTFKTWSVEAFEFAKQYVFEKIGKIQKTADLELEKKVECVKETQRQFRVLYDLARNLSFQYKQVVHTQRILSEVFVDLSHRNPEEGLCEQFNCNSLTQRLLARNGEALLGCLDAFLKSMLTLCNTTIEDTLATVKSLETNRLKFDAYRSYLEKVQAAPRDHQYTLRLQEAERNFTKYQAKYNRLHHDLNIKLKFLDENKVKVCQKHLFLFHKGFLDYIAGNRQGIEDILHQFGCYSSYSAMTNPTTFLEVPVSLTSTTFDTTAQTSGTRSSNHPSCDSASGNGSSLASGSAATGPAVAADVGSAESAGYASAAVSGAAKPDSSIYGSLSSSSSGNYEQR